MQIFAGLGNPGPAYAFNRHNIGFMAVDVLHGVHGFAPWKSRFHGLAAEGRLGAHKILLLKPMTFMNESGRSVGEVLRFFKLAPEMLTVFHDDLDLDPFRVKVKTGGGSGGQNGLRSIDRHIGTHYRRVRIGIGHPGHKDRVTPWVLSNFPKSDEDRLTDFLADIADLAPLLAERNDSRFLNDLALRAQT